MRPAALVVLNPAARAGTAADRFTCVLPRLESRFRLRVVETDPAGAWIDKLAGELSAGVRVVVAAGGDGTVHAVGRALLALDAPRDVVLGAVGLGSSNDFHKPVREAMAGIPLRIDTTSIRARDLVVASWRDRGGDRREPVMVSASMGIVARANARFNRSDALLGILRRHWTHGAIAYAAVRTILERPAFAARIELPHGSWEGELASVSVLETPHLSGTLRYDLPASDDDGAVTVALIAAGSRFQLLRRLVELGAGRFRGGAGTWHWQASALTIERQEPGELELDGEVRTAGSVRFHVLPGRILTCP